MMDERRSRASIDALRNPFGRDSTYEGVPEEEEDQLEVDLTSWGLDAFMPKDKESKHTRRKTKSEVFPNPHPQFPSGLRPRAEAGRRGTSGMRTMSLGNLDMFGEGGAFLDAQSTVDSMGVRRHSIGSPLDFPGMQLSEERLQRRRTSSAHALIENLPVTPPLHSIPFPTSESVRSVSPMPNEGPSARPSSRGSFLNPSAHGRTYSTASMGSRMLLDEKESNPFAVRPPSPDRASRFDPKAARARTMSGASMGTMMSPPLMEEEHNPFALRPPSPSRSSRFDPKVRARTMSNGTLGTQMLLDNDGLSSDGERPPRPRHYSRLELMRPKLLIMPSPLQSAAPAAPPPPTTVIREGFELHDDGRPLPPGARAARRSSTTLSMIEPSTSGLIASNSFTPNPRASLTLSQLTFRNTLVVDGQRDPAYADIETGIRRATEDGEQIEPEQEEEPHAPTPMPAIVIDPADRSKHPAGKLYGKSLIDDIEARKAEMRSKQRVFRGDDRPTMMARTSMKRSSTLIDPESLKQRPVSQRMDSFRSQPELARRNSANRKTLINFEDEIPGVPQRQQTRLGVDPTTPGNKKSVFGVDTLWERELAKLRQIEERERLEEEEERRKQVEQESKHAKKKGKGRKKGKHKDRGEEPESQVPISVSTSDIAPEQRAPSPPYQLPMIHKTTARRRPLPPAGDDDVEDESDSSEAHVNVGRASRQDAEIEEWVAGSSDEETKGPRRTTGSGPRYPNSSPGAPRLVRQDDDSSEEDLPLVATISRAAQRMTRAEYPEDSSDEEKPLSVLLDKTKLKLPSVGSLGGSLFAEGSVKNGDEDEDDDKPLGLRVSRIVNSSQAPSSNEQNVEDDRPLAFHPEQMRRTQYMMAQQQQVMMQAQAAQLHQSMIFGAPSMMSSGFFGPPMGPPMMIHPQIPATTPSMHDAAKFGRVDKWRRDVAVEGDQ
ncbi:hypothetical protein AcW1_004365 [Taiwanofungus camphoratus]|nr:hypothetical protein AcW2_006628 [Antrodia cinnamomea]KAI0939280.1 hypothetical protein AcV5_000743 [Antrodia cinnamomea]KAI0952203.1 hypothetical protein AcV7_008082 [Antrodia cinnamomea]KAI0959575.1 hypothetical protein AcW1_004365 [Antrodia cinnamomea]